jgi:5-methylcytosine-specific restriction endonuclease McrA
MATKEGTDLTALSLDELEDELATLASHLYAGTCRWLELVAEADRRGGWAESGRGSCAEWLAWRCALTPRAAREHVRVARRLGELPLIHGAFAQGELSYAKVRALTRVATAENEGELLELARVFTAAQLERAVRAYRRVTSEEAREQQEDACLSVFWEPDGSLSIHGRLAPEDGALLLRALEAQRDARWKERRGSAEPRPLRQASNAEALVAVAEAALARSVEGRPAGERYQVVVHVDEPALADDGEGGCELDDGSALAPETARRLACDASVVQNGRKTRAIPPAMRRALRARDRGCRFPGCENRRFLDGHHVHHWAHGGATTLDNLVLLCRHHHRLVHESGWRVDRHLRFHDPWGRPFPAVPPLPRGDPDELVAGNRDLQIAANTCEPGTGEAVELADAVDALLSISSPPASSAYAEVS